jgi:hypothetical protein
MVACLVFTIFSSAQAEEFALGPAVYIPVEVRSALELHSSVAGVDEG